MLAHGEMVPTAAPRSGTRPHPRVRRRPRRPRGCAPARPVRARAVIRHDPVGPPGAGDAELGMQCAEAGFEPLASERRQGRLALGTIMSGKTRERARRLPGWPARDRPGAGHCRRWRARDRGLAGVEFVQRRQQLVRRLGIRRARCRPRPGSSACPPGPRAGRGRIRPRPGSGRLRLGSGRSFLASVSAFRRSGEHHTETILS